MKYKLTRGRNDGVSIELIYYDKVSLHHDIFKHPFEKY